MDNDRNNPGCTSTENDDSQQLEEGESNEASPSERSASISTSQKDSKTLSSRPRDGVDDFDSRPSDNSISPPTTGPSKSSSTAVTACIEEQSNTKDETMATTETSTLTDSPSNHYTTGPIEISGSSEPPLPVQVLGVAETNNGEIPTKSKDKKMTSETACAQKAQSSWKSIIDGRVLSSLVVALIVGGIITYFATTWWESIMPSALELTFSASPSLAGTFSPSEYLPSAAPTVAFRFDPPLEEDCHRIRKGEDVSGQDSLIKQSFEITLDVAMQVSTSQSETMDTLEMEIQNHLMPKLVGCGDTPSRNLRHNRMLNNRYNVANGKVQWRLASLEDTPECSFEMCLGAKFDIDLFLKSADDMIENLLEDVFGDDLVDSLKLESPPFMSVVVRAVTNRRPTMTPSSTPSVLPSNSSTDSPTRQPSQLPSNVPEIAPIANSIRIPTDPPTFGPSLLPTVASTVLSTTAPLAPTLHPTPKPTPMPSPRPTKSPTKSPSRFPTTQPSVSPSSQPTSTPSVPPTPGPSLLPSVAPTNSPTTSSQPTKDPSLAPSPFPSSVPSLSPSQTPSLYPSMEPTAQPSMSPSSQPTTSFPSFEPTTSPTVSLQPSLNPTPNPTLLPSSRPSRAPTQSPSFHPTKQPSISPSAQPTESPSLRPTKQPTISPSSKPTNAPSVSPTPFPTVSRAPTLSPTITPLRIACAGDSLTRGTSGGNSYDSPYPYQLQQMLGGRFRVINYGRNAMTAKTYVDTNQFQGSLNVKPDIYLLMLGTNDAREWDSQGQKYRQRMEWIVDRVRSISMESPPRIIVAIPPWVKADNFGIRNEVLVSSIQPEIRTLATLKNVELVDMYDVTYNQNDMFVWDGVHLNKKGYRAVAEAWKLAIQCNQNGVCEVGESCSTCPGDCRVDC